MYVAYSGLTELRIVGILGTSLATLGLAIVVYKVARGRTMLWVLRRQLDALAIAIAVFVVAPTDDLAMRYNVARIAADQYRPLLHLYEQPIRAEAVPALLPLLDHPDPMVRQGVAVLLAAERARLVANDASATSWLDFELARHRALDALDDAATRLAEVLPHRARRPPRRQRAAPRRRVRHQRRGRARRGRGAVRLAHAPLFAPRVTAGQRPAAACRRPACRKARHDAPLQDSNNFGMIDSLFEI
jgi:hypothetical protein